jgi:aryl-alcohol dehydrogenase-like predicted oxidoreductase
LAKAARVTFLAGEDVGRTMSQAAIKFCLAQPSIVSVLPNFTNLDELREYTAAPETPDLTEEEQSRLDDLWQHGFDLEDPAPEFREV